MTKKYTERDSEIFSDDLFERTKHLAEAVSRSIKLSNELTNDHYHPNQGPFYAYIPLQIPVHMHGALPGLIDRYQPEENRQPVYDAQVARRNYVDAVMGGLNVGPTDQRPENPNPGDAYFDTIADTTFVFTGEHGWVRFAVGNGNYPNGPEPEPLRIDYDNYRHELEQIERDMERVRPVAVDVDIPPRFNVGGFRRGELNIAAAYGQPEPLRFVGRDEIERVRQLLDANNVPVVVAQQPPTRRIWEPPVEEHRVRFLDYPPVNLWQDRQFVINDVEARNRYMEELRCDFRPEPYALIDDMPYVNRRFDEIYNQQMVGRALRERDYCIDVDEGDGDDNDDIPVESSAAAIEMQHDIHRSNCTQTVSRFERLLNEGQFATLLRDAVGLSVATIGRMMGLDMDAQERMIAQVENINDQQD